MAQLGLPCFACHPRSTHAALRERSPAALCLPHKQRCTLPDGVPLSEALATAAPPGFPLEGSSLAYIYNPVFVPGPSGERLKGWTDFVGGGMAVFEDRWSSATRFEHWALEHDALQPLWRPLLDSYLRDGPRTDIHTLELPRDPGHPHRWFASCWAGVTPAPLPVVGVARDNWRLGQLIEARRQQASSPWPRNFSEVEEWLAPPTVDADPSEGFSFTQEMVRLAKRWAEVHPFAV